VHVHAPIRSGELAKPAKGRTLRGREAAIFTFAVRGRDPSRGHRTWTRSVGEGQRDGLDALVPTSTDEEAPAGTGERSRRERRYDSGAAGLTVVMVCTRPQRPVAGVGP